MTTPSQCTIGFIGTGVMGASMAANLMRAGHPLRVFTRTKARAQGLIEGGAVWCDDVASLAATSDVVITIVGFPHDVREVYLAAGGIVQNARPGTLLIDMTTSRPDLAQEIASAAADKGLQAIDAPVSGGDIGAREARLAIMVGATPAAYEKALPVLSPMGQNIVRQGDPGAGQYTKMANQIVVAGTMMGVCESMAYAKKAGLDPHMVLQSIGSGAAASWALSNLMPRALKGDFSPGFFVKHFIKDMTIALESAEALGMPLPGLRQARALYERVAKTGGQDDGTQALLRLYENGAQI